MKKFFLVYFALLQIIILLFSKNLFFYEKLMFSLILWLNYMTIKESKFNIKSPIFLFGLVFNICNIVHVLYLANILNFNILYTSTSGFEFSRNTYSLSLLLNLVGALFIFLGIRFSISREGSTKNNTLNTLTWNTLIMQNSNVFLIMGILFYLAYIFSYGGFIQFYSNLYFIRSGKVQANIPLLQMIGNFRYIFYLGLFIEIYNYKEGRQSKNKFQILMLIIIAFLIALSSGGRFTTSFIFLQLFILIYDHKKINISSIVLAVVFALIIIIFFPVKWSFFRFLMGDITIKELISIYMKNSKNFVNDLIGNHLGAFSAFIILLEHGRIFIPELFLKPITNLISILVPRRFLINTIFEYRTVFEYYNEIINYDRYILGEFHFNFLGYFYIILGYAGIVIFSLLWGYFLGSLEKKYLIKNYDNYPIYLYIYPSFIFLIAMNGSFDPYIRSLAYRLIGLCVCLFIIFAKKRFREIIQKYE